MARDLGGLLGVEGVVQRGGVILEVTISLRSKQARAWALEMVEELEMGLRMAQSVVTSARKREVVEVSAG